MNKVWTIILIILGILILVNVGILDWWIVGGGKLEVGNWKLEKGVGNEVVEEEKIASPSCELSCQSLIEEKIKEELAKLPSPAGQSSVPDGTGQSSTSVPVQTKAVPTTVNGKPKVVYVPLIAYGSTSSNTWVDVVPSEFYFDLTDYPNAKEVRFEAYLSSSNNDLMGARIYDATNKRAVDYSELQSRLNSFTRVESSAMSIWRGRNKYTVQLRSINGTFIEVKDAKLKTIY